MKPRVAVVVREKFKDFLLPARITEHLGNFADYQVVNCDLKNSPAELAASFAGMDGAITSWEIPRLDRPVLDKCDRLKIISHAGGMVRYFLDEEVYVLKPGIVICNASNVMAQPVAEFALTAALACLRHLWFFREWVAGSERWEEYEPEKNVSLLRKKVGLVGLGQIAREFIKLVRPFNVELHVFSNHLDEQECAREGFIKTDLSGIFSSCDVIVLSAANTPENRHMIRREHLRSIKEGGVLVNIARGALVDEQALIEELRSGRFLAALDVTDPEPPAADNPLRDMPNVLLTPHIAGPTPGQRIWMMEEAVRNLEAFFNGQPVNGLIDLKRFRYMA
ncbi:MAG: hypothetical protein A3F83_16830 [Candidatus Glassbacteria bacterium RIFCSPLOWO2_12_FULL_58_11]|uniref:D-isomer specific 2-hydroxyacid dehydrogenase NAD-binding domain-containing protein n=1 Tax=Candidatus Glassbacteria bacterium RIFCSPLOWO2_12_FULL_58_11 TaxID=1817867 RepID=A0A1F5YLN2_9BACT|nr:MAG: hypothetical protein A3F83_16830 [Candidatus Glassbacteria bacterium RIFCSPLOWO2_12_FULL_58_11]